MRFEMGFDRQRAQQMALGIAPPLPVKCVEGFRISDLPGRPGFIVVAIPSDDESDFACALELEAVIRFAAERVAAEGGKRDPKAGLYDAVSSTSLLPISIIPRSVMGSQGAHS